MRFSKCLIAIIIYPHLYFSSCKLFVIPIASSNLSLMPIFCGLSYHHLWLLLLLFSEFRELIYAWCVNDEQVYFEQGFKWHYSHKLPDYPLLASYYFLRVCSKYCNAL